MNWLKWGKWALVALMAVGLFGLGHHVAAADGDTKLAKAEAVYAKERLALATEAATAESSARLADQVKAKALSDIAEQHEKDKKHAQEDADRLVGDLRSGVVRLRDEWATCRATSQVLVAAGGSKPDAVPDDQAASAGRIVRAAQDADDTIRALQATLTKERQ